MDTAVAADFFDPAKHDLMWTRRWFCPYDVNHCLFETVRDRDTKKLKVFAFLPSGKIFREYDEKQFRAGYVDFLFYDAVIWDPRWYV